MADNKLLLIDDLNMVLNLLRHLGFLINEKKSIIVPSQVIEFLGVKIDSLSLSFSLPDDKVDKVIQRCEKAFGLGKISLWQLASIMRNFSWAIPTVSFAQAHKRNLQRFYITESRRRLATRSHLILCLVSLQNFLFLFSRHLTPLFVYYQKSSEEGVTPPLGGRRR